VLIVRLFIVEKPGVVDGWRIGRRGQPGPEQGNADVIGITVI
jgi:hypothetical protein